MQESKPTAEEEERHRHSQHCHYRDVEVSRRSERPEDPCGDIQNGVVCYFIRAGYRVDDRHRQPDRYGLESSGCGDERGDEERRPEMGRMMIRQ